MNEVLLQTIIEKLEVLEIALLKQNGPTKDCESLEMLMKSIQSELIRLSLERGKNTDCVTDLSNQIKTLRLNNSDPEENQVKHIHHFHKQIWISLSLLIVSLLCAYGWMNCHNEKKQFEANDMKYRFWKANGNPSLLKIIYQTDSIYELDKNNFKDQVLEAERQIKELEEKHRLAIEKEREK